MTLFIIHFRSIFYNTLICESESIYDTSNNSFGKLNISDLVIDCPCDNLRRKVVK